MAAKRPVSEAVHRHWTLLRLIPRAPRKIDGATLEGLLAAEGIQVTRRSIQRDLESLSRVFGGLRCDDASKPYGWCWDDSSPLLEVPGMNLSSAVTFELLKQHLTDALPRSTVRTLHNYFKRAREVLAGQPDAKMARWPSKIRVMPRGLPRLAPNVDRKVQDAVYGALLEERRLRVRYRKRHADADADYEVSPLGLVLRNGTLVLVATFWDYDDVNQMLLHRMRSATPVAARARRPRGFDLDAYIHAGHVGFKRSDKRIKLRARLHPDVAIGLHEAPLGKDQQLSPDDDWEQLKVTVPDTTELRSWLRSHGAMIEVIAPKRLRREMAVEAMATEALYRS